MESGSTRRTREETEEIRRETERLERRSNRVLLWAGVITTAACLITLGNLLLIWMR